MPALTVTATAQQAARIAHAIGVADNLGHDASVAEVQTNIQNHLRGLVIAIERQEAAVPAVDLT
jgi:hypothetical protein